MGRLKKDEKDKRRMIMVSIKPEVLEKLNSDSKKCALNRSKYIEKLILSNSVWTVTHNEE